MKLAAIALMTLASSSLAHAEVFKCSFTEPFVDFTYNTATQTLVEKEVSENTTLVLKNISFQVAGPALFLLKDASGKLVAKLELNNRGSDGMSDTIYPYDVNYPKMIHGANNGVGGCTSSLLRARQGSN